MAWPKGKPRPKVTKDSVEAPEAAASVPVVEAGEHEAVQTGSPISAAALGELAKHLLENPSFHDAYRRAISDVFKAWEATDPADTAKREALYHRINALRSIKDELGRIKQEGKIANVRSERLRIA